MYGSMDTSIRTHLLYTLGITLDGFTFWWHFTKFKLLPFDSHIIIAISKLDDHEYLRHAAEVKCRHPQAAIIRL